jgi:ketosteroid isomerase-like protein
MIRPSLISYALVLIFTCTCAGHSGADPLADEISLAAAKWDAAINNADFDALLPLYTADGRLMPPGVQPVIGPLAIRNFFAGRGRSVRNHKVELVDVLSFGNYAYTASHFTATLVLDEKAAPISGSTVRLHERQPDGQWKIKSHIFVRE